MARSGSGKSAVVLPLREGAREQALALLESGPPFDPASTKLERHEVFLTDREVVFVFDSSLDLEALEPLLGNPDLWRAADAWRDFLDGPPRLAESVYSWSKPEETEELSFLATPGPGDSDGGDVFG